MSQYIRGNFRSETRKKDEEHLLANDALMLEIQLKGSFVLIKGEQPLVIEGKKDG